MGSLEYSGVRAVFEASGFIHQMDFKNASSTLSFKEDANSSKPSDSLDSYSNNGCYTEPFVNAYAIKEAIQFYFGDREVAV